MLNDFIGSTKNFSRNPLGIIALFVTLIYGVAALVLSTSIDNLKGDCERLPLIWFIIIFPIIVLIIFTYLVVCHHEKLYGPSDFKDENNFMLASSGKVTQEDLDRAKTVKPKSNLEITSLSKEIKADEILLYREIPLNNFWVLNHWGGNTASLVKEKIIFQGSNAPNGSDGCHIDLINFLEVAKNYKVSCFASSKEGTTAKLQLWCHDESGRPNGISIITDPITPSVKGEFVSMNFKAEFNQNIRIHLQYTPGEGAIEVSKVVVEEVKTIL